MNMIATGALQNSKQSFQCLRCGHEETRRIER
jgi:transcription elongation factor Elf1